MRPVGCVRAQRDNTLTICDDSRMADVLPFDRGRRKVRCPGCDTPVAVNDLVGVEFAGAELAVCKRCRGGTKLLEAINELEK